MVELDQFKGILNSYEEPLKEMRVHFDLSGKEKQVEELERKIEEPGFWENTENSQIVMKELKSLKDFLEKVSQLTTSYEDIGVLIEMAYDENDESLVPEIESELTAFQQGYEEIRIQTLLSGEYDKDNAIVTLHAGAGGTESCDWANMLYRMYTRWAERKDFPWKCWTFWAEM